MNNKARIFLMMVLMGALLIGLMAPGNGRSHTALAAAPDVVIDDFEDGNASDWIFFGGNAAGGGGGIADDRPQEGAYYLSTGWGGEGTSSSFYGGFFKNFDNAAQIALPADPWFNVWVLNQSNATVDQYTLEITIREDLDGSGWTNGAEDSFRLDTTFTSASFDDQWTLVSGPVSGFTDLATGGDGIFNGDLDEVVIVVAGVQGVIGTTVELDLDQLSFTSGGPLVDNRLLVDDFENGLPSGVDGNGLNIGFETFSDGSPVSIATTNTPPAALPGSDAGNNVMALTGNVGAFAGFTHKFENTAVDAWVPQDWSQFEGISFWLYGQNSGADLFVDILDNRNPGSTTDDAERFVANLTDDFSGWQYFELPFSSFTRKEIGNGAPNDGLTLTQMHGWALGMLSTSGSELTVYIDEVALYGVAEIPELAVTFAASRYDIEEGATGDIAVKLNRPMNSDDPAQVSIDYYTEPGVAIPDREYAPVSGTLTFVNGGPSELSFPLQTFDDTKWEGDERIVVRLTNPVDVAAGFATQASAFIIENDPYDPNLIEDFSYGAFQWESNGTLALETADIESGDADAIPGQDAYEAVLQAAPVAGIAPRAAIVQIAADAEALLPTDSNRVDLRLRKAMLKLDGSLNADYWENDYYLDSKKGINAYNRLYSALKDLNAAARYSDDPAAIQNLIHDLVNVGQDMARVEVNLAAASHVKHTLLERAQNQFDDALAAQAMGNDERAFRLYRTAWSTANAALKNVTPAPAAFSRDFAIGQDWSHGEALTFWYYGSNSGADVTVHLKDNRAPDPGPSGWSMVWSEEFDEAAGTPPNPNNWTYEIGDVTPDGKNGWGNDELQYYTDDPANAATDGQGNMVLTVREADGSLECYYGTCEYTSARLISWRKAEFAYGRIESRILVPQGGGIWPAFWSLGTDIDLVPWPQTGEIDFMEFVGRLPTEIFGTIHGPGYSGGQSYGNIYDFGEPVFNSYHTFAVEWEPDLIKWYVDDILYHTATPADIAPNEWVFNDPVFLLLNVAIGGNFGGAVDPNIPLPQSMKVDYIRVYQGPDTAERFETTFVDDFSGWQRVELPFTSFARSAEQPDGAPDDGLTLTDVWGMGFTLPDGAVTAMLDGVSLKLAPPPTAVTVTSLADSGAGSLREALDIIAPDGTITFDPSLSGGTIALTSGQLVVGKNVTIDGSGAPSLTVSGSNASRVFQIAAAVTVSMNDLTIADGAGAPQGGGILNFGTLNLDTVTVTNNTETSGGAPAFDFGGGGIYNGDGAVLNLTNSAVSNNSTLGQPGGGIYGFFNSTINITNSTVSGNVAGDVAGGMRVLGNVNMVNSTISGNTSTAWHGGAMFATDGVVTILNSTIVGNNAPGGTAGGIFVGTFGAAPVTLTLQNSIVAGNSEANCFQGFFGGGAVTLTSLGNNVATDGTCVPIGSDQVVADAGVAALSDNGGPTLTHALLAGSVAIDAANTAVCPAADQRGVARDAACDVGAFEFVP